MKFPIRFPNDVNLRQRWMETLGLDAFADPSERHRVCSKHFHPSCFGEGSTVRKLRRGSIPETPHFSSLIQESTAQDKEREKIETHNEELRKVIHFDHPYYVSGSAIQISEQNKKLHESLETTTKELADCRR